MRKSEKIKKRRKSLISVSPLTLVTVVAFILFGYGTTLLSYAVVLLLHEFAHAFVAERLGYSLSSVRILPYGISISGEFEGLRPEHEIAIAFAGPLINLSCWIVITGIWWLAPESYAATQMIAEASLFTALVNLIPVYPLDGGRVLHGMLSVNLRPETVRRIIYFVGLAFGTAMVACSMTLIVLGANFTYATLCIFIVASLILPNGGSKYERVYSMLNSGRRLKRGLRVREIMVTGDATLLRLYKMLRPDYYTRFVVTDETMRPIAEITETDLDGLLGEFSASEKVISVAKRIKT